MQINNSLYLLWVSRISGQFSDAVAATANHYYNSRCQLNKQNHRDVVGEESYKPTYQKTKIGITQLEWRKFDHKSHTFLCL